MTKIFVYGTLKRGYSRSSALQGEVFLGSAVTKPLYRMYDCGDYPGLVEAPDGLCIEGELWEVSDECLKRLDDIEGVAIDLYERNPVILQQPYEQESAETYFYQQDVTGLTDCGTRWT